MGRVVDHTTFSKIGEYLSPGDLLVINQTLVIPARLFGKKSSTGGRVEVLLLQRIDEGVWECLVGGKGLTQGKKVILEDETTAEILEVLEGPRRVVKFSKTMSQVLKDIGQVPLPPYITEKLNEPGRYQTVYAKEPGSVAAPTAGLHFTDGLMNRLLHQGIKFTTVTLHIGLDTFSPVKEENPHNHEIHTEWCRVTPESAELINKTKHNGGRVIAVGTTSVRALETASCVKKPNGAIVGEYSGFTSLFILPGYNFQVIDAMITNFHLPQSSLIMLVSAFLGRENVLAAYHCARKMDYRFYSFGDAMFIA